MSKVRIHEYAKANNVSSKQLIENLKSMGVEVSNHMSAIEEETLNKAKQGNKPAPAKSQGQGQQNRPQGNSQGGNRNNNNTSSNNKQGGAAQANRGGGNRPGAQGRNNNNNNRGPGQGRPGNNNRRNQGTRGGKRRGGPQNKPNHQQMPLPEKSRFWIAFC